jgi:hypothetical protein
MEAGDEDLFNTAPQELQFAIFDLATMNIEQLGRTRMYGGSFATVSDEYLEDLANRDRIVDPRTGQTVPLRGKSANEIWALARSGSIEILPRLPADLVADVQMVGRAADDIANEWNVNRRTEEFNVLYRNLYDARGSQDQYVTARLRLLTLVREIRQSGELFDSTTGAAVGDSVTDIEVALGLTKGVYVWGLPKR